jgi:hypothetical protein
MMSSVKNSNLLQKIILNDLYGKNWKIPDKKYYWEKNKNKTILINIHMILAEDIY